MTQPFDPTGTSEPTHLVLVNTAGARSLWPVFLPVPHGLGQGTRPRITRGLSAGTDARTARASKPRPADPAEQKAGTRIPTNLRRPCGRIRRPHFRFPAGTCQRYVRRGGTTDN